MEIKLMNYGPVSSTANSLLQALNLPPLKSLKLLLNTAERQQN
jgi:hypothetical protein